MDAHDAAATSTPAYTATGPSPATRSQETVPTDAAGGLVEALDTIAKARHDLNNHLTSALAEIQLLLMDVSCDELKESYEVIQEQLRKMRRVVASTAHLSPPK